MSDQSYFSMVRLLRYPNIACRAVYSWFLAYANSDLLRLRKGVCDMPVGNGSLSRTESYSVWRAPFFDKPHEPRGKPAPPPL